MREIKFRAWHPRLNRFSAVFKIGDSPYYPTMVGGSVDCKRSDGVDEQIYCQFTSLRDINGVDIYEGDIVYLAGYGDYIAEFPFIELYEAATENDIGKIIGNIYQNPELLEDKK